MRTSFAQRVATTLTLALAACSTAPGGPEYAELGLRALDASGAELQRECVPLPVLPGGVVDKDLTLAPGLGAQVHTEQDFAEVALSGTNDPASARVTVPRTTLLGGYTKTLAVTTTSGDAYSVVLLGPCVPPVPLDGG
jgi:hypothetical protein